MHLGGTHATELDRRFRPGKNSKITYLPNDPVTVGSSILLFTIGAILVIIICATLLVISIRSLSRSGAG